MLKTIDILLGVAVVMLIVSMCVTMLTQAVNHLRETAGKKGWEVAWESYSRAHGLDQQRFRNELSKLRARFQSIATAKK